MSDYERLAADLTAAGIKASVATARRLATMAWCGATLAGDAAAVVAAWEARTLATPWRPDITRNA